jgi:hypothetical protein
MRCTAFGCVMAILCGPALPQERKAAAPPPTQFEIGLHTFFDFGPPFDYYELFLVRPSGNATSVRRITLTPPGDACFAPAKVETASASLNDSVETLLGSTNPCAIPEKALHRELKRCKHCMVFSGANVVMQVQCGTESRLIRSDILDRDWFDPAAKTPEHTSWTMGLLDRLERALGPGVMDKPAFASPEDGSSTAVDLDPTTLSDLISGKYDPLFSPASNKPSDLYLAAQNKPPSPSVRLTSSLPVSPELYVAPEYPSLARRTHTEGAVSFKVDIDVNGAATNLVFESGHPLLLEAVKKAVRGWRFPKNAANQQVSVRIEFSSNCTPQSEKR